MSVNSPPQIKHYHADEQGLLRACYHKCRTSALSFGFWIGLTMGFMPEHYLWEKVPPFSYVTHWLGL